MRVLFLHAALHHSPEYDSHRTLAAHTDPDQVQSYFVWQTGKRSPAIGNGRALVEDYFYDFGRDLTLEPRPSRVRRASMMATRFPGGALLIRRLVRRVRPDVVYTAQQKYDVFLGNAVSRLFRIPHVIHVHYPFGPWLGNRTGRTILRAPRLVAASEFIRQDLIKAGVPPEHVYTRHEAIPLERFECLPQGHDVRAEFGWPAGAPLITAVGRLDPSKGHMLLFDAFSRVARECPGARLLVCGWTTHTGYDLALRRRVQELGLEDRVVFAGARNDIPAIYADTDVFCLPTEDDACPLVFLEAMAAGLPAVGVVSGGVPEMVVHGETGLLSPPGDADGLAANLLTLLRDPSLRRCMGEAGKRRLASEFEPGRAAEQWTDVLHRLLPGLR